jgi:hypothetical protein
LETPGHACGTLLLLDVLLLLLLLLGCLKTLGAARTWFTK